MAASPETGSEKHRVDATQIAWAYAFALNGTECGRLTDAIAAALARVEAETRREFEDERAALRAVLTPLRELAAKATNGGAWRASDSGARRALRSNGRCGTPNHEGCVIVTASDIHEPGRADRDIALLDALVYALPALLKLAEKSAGTEPVAGDAPPTHESLGS